ncbi:MAG: EVE domain-containing protein [Fimbriimonadales bacterium]
MAERRYWLMKSEPDTYSYEDLEKEERGQGHWEGVRNFQARNFMKNDMKVGDRVLFYYSSCPEPGIAGIAEVASEAYPDHTQFDPKSHYYDPTAREEKPKWWMVDLRAIEKLPHYVSLKTMRETPELADMITLRKGNRLSITPVTESDWRTVLRLGGKP